MKLLDEDCGCDDNYFSVINNSPLLNGEQEATFDPMNNSNNLNNLIINDALDLPSPKKENSGKPIVFGRAKNNVNKENKINGNNIEMNNIKLNDTSMNNMNNMNNAMNNAMNNGPMQPQMSQQMPQQMQQMSPQMSPQMQQQMSPQMQQQMNNALNAQNAQLMNSNNGDLDGDYDESKSSHFKTLATNVNYILLIVLAVALNDVAKFYINRAIKYQNGNHKYYLYYVGILTLVIYLMSRMSNKL